MTGSLDLNKDAKTNDFVVCELKPTGLCCRKSCTTEDNNHEAFIATEDILCVLPHSAEGKSGYRVLYLQKHEIPAAGSGTYTRLESIQTASLPSALLSQYLCTEIPHLNVSPKTQGTAIHVVISSGSGAGSAKDTFQNIVQPLLLLLGSTGVRVHETVSSQSIAELTQSIFIEPARAGVSQTVILLSGDGGLADMVDVFYKNVDLTKPSLTPPSIVLIPSGTGNAMASSIGSLQSPTSAIKTLLRGRPARLPVFRATFSPGSQYITDEGRTRTPVDEIYGAVVASWGMHAALVADSDTTEYRKFGVDRFKMAAKELLYPSSGAETHRYRGQVSLTMGDCQTGERRVETLDHNEHMYLLATLVSRLEKNFVISPDSKPLDGRLRLIRFGPMPPDQAMNMMALAYQNGKHVHERAVEYVKVESLKVELQEDEENWRRLCVDGKIVAVPQGGWMEVCKESQHLLNLIIWE